MSHPVHNNHEEHMPSELTAPPQEMFDLLTDRALVGLDVTDSNRLLELVEEFPWVRDDYMDEAVALMSVGFHDSDPDDGRESMPADVGNRIMQRLDIMDETGPIAGIGGSNTHETGPIGWFGWVGWAAAAAAITVAATIWQPTVAPINTSAQLASWSQAHPDAVRWDWAPGLANPAEDVTGYVTFSPEAQEGFMMIKGLEPNDPRVQQYQLWIWDRDREIDPANPQPLAENVHPVDGGVFDVNDQGEVVIPIKAPLRVGQPYLFAVTVERPGGVVKSDKSWVPLIAGPPADA